MRARYKRQWRSTLRHAQLTGKPLPATPRRRCAQLLAHPARPDGSELHRAREPDGASDKLKDMCDKRRKNPKILVDTGHLTNSIVTAVCTSFPHIVTHIVYAAIGKGRIAMIYALSVDIKNGFSTRATHGRFPPNHRSLRHAHAPKQ